MKIVRFFLAVTFWLCLTCNVHAVTTHTVSDETELQNALDSAADGDTILITRDIILSQKLNNIGLSDRTITIKGQNGTIVNIDGNNITEIFAKPSVSSGGKVIFENVNFLNASRVGDGGAFNMYNGGMAAGETVVEFQGNDVTFQNNEATSNGAVISDGTFTFKNSGDANFIGNNAGGGGAVIYNDRDMTTITFQNAGNVVFQGNIATGDGAVNHGSRMVFENGGDIIMQGNTARNGGVAYGGSMIFSGAGNVTVRDNRATTGDGGAFEQGEYTFERSGTVLFENNTASSGLGGAFRIAGNTLTLAPQGKGTVIFQGNSDTSGANAIYLHNGAVLNLNPEANAKILFHDPIGSSDALSRVVQDGAGETQFWENSAFKGITDIKQGTFRLMEADTVFGDDTDGTNFTVRNGATFGIAIDPNGTDVSSVNANSFTAESGGRLKISNLSALAAGTQKTYHVVHGVNGGGVVSPIPVSMGVNNALVSASLVQNGDDADLQIDMVRNLSDVFGRNSITGFGDLIRTNLSISPYYRDLLDQIYADGVLNEKSVEVLGAASGMGVLAATGARRQNWHMFTRAMNNRMNGTHYAVSQDGTIYRGKASANQGKLWGTFSRNWNKQDTTSDALGYKYSPFAFTFGKDRQIGRWNLGLAFQYDHGEVRTDGTSYTNTKMDGATIGAYGTWRGNRYYTKSNVQIGGNWSKETTYLVTGDSLHGSYDSFLLGTGLEFGRTFTCGNRELPFQLAPHIGVDYAFFNSSAFSENGNAAMARSFGSVNFNAVEIPVGIRLAKTYQTCNRLACFMTPSLELAYMRSVGDNIPIGSVTLLNTPSAAWRTTGSDAGRDAFRLGAGLNTHFRHCIDLGIGYDLETRQNYTSQQFNTTLCLSY